MHDLHYAPLEEIQRVRRLDLPAHQRTALFANLCRINTLYMITRAGSGHIGTSFSSIDIVSWLFLNELRLESDANSTDRDIYFSSKGHDVPALYSILIGLELLPFELIHMLRRKGGLPGHPDVHVPHLVTNTGSLGMGISKAIGFALAKRLTGQRGNVFVLTGDGELQEGQFWESLISAANRKMREITLIIDHNKLQSDTFVSLVSDLGDLTGKLQSFGWHTVRVCGHDLESFGSVIDMLRHVDAPKAIIADTIKGRGVSFMEHTAMRSEDKRYRFHSGAPDYETYKRAVTELLSNLNDSLASLGQPILELETVTVTPRTTPATPQRLIAAYEKELVKQAESNKRIVVFDADLLLDCGLIPFKERYPERFIECGISEQNMVSQAGAAALGGLLPIVHSFACFLSSRPNEQIYNNATEKTKVIYVGSLAGLLPGGAGHSHQCVRDISALGAIPGLILLEPCNESELAEALDFCVNGTSYSCYLRLVSVPYDVPFSLPVDSSLELGRGRIINQGDSAVVFTYGPVMLSEAFNAAQMIKQRYDQSLRIVNLPWLNLVDREWLQAVVDKMPWMFTIDNHYLVGGQGDMLLREIAGFRGRGELRVRRFGLEQVPVCGTNEEVLRWHRLDAESLATEISLSLGLSNASIFSQSKTI